MSFDGTTYIPENNCPCEDAVVGWRKAHGQRELVVLSCPHNCEMPAMDGGNEQTKVIRRKP